MLYCRYMRIVQCLLRGENCSQVCWLREEERLKVGASIMLDEDYRTWIVETVGYPQDFWVVQELTEPVVVDSHGHT